MKKILILLVAALMTCGGAGAQSWLDALKGAASSAVDKATGGKATEKMLQGTWSYPRPGIKLVSDSTVAEMAASAAATTLQSKLETAYTFVGIKPGACTFVFNGDKTFSAVLSKRTLGGTYEYEAATHRITLHFSATKFNLGTMSGHAYINGTALDLVFPCEKLLTMLTKLGSQISSLNGITGLLKNYDNMMIGFEFTK